MSSRYKLCLFFREYVYHPELFSSHIWLHRDYLPWREHSMPQNANRGNGHTMYLESLVCLGFIISGEIRMYSLRLGHEKEEMCFPLCTPMRTNVACRQKGVGAMGNRGYVPHMETIRLMSLSPFSCRARLKSCRVQSKHFW